MKMTVGKKPSRAEAYALILDMKTGRRELQDHDVDALLRFFAPSLPKRAKTAEQWVAKAAGVKDERKSLRYVHVKNGFAYASDGHRSHRAETTLDDGFYDPKTMLPVDFTEAPLDILRTFPDRRNFEPITIEALEHEAVNEKGGKPIEYVRVPDSVAVNRFYFVDAVNEVGTGVVLYTESAMVGDSEFGDWVVMGARV